MFEIFNSFSYPDSHNRSKSTSHLQSSRNHFAFQSQEEFVLTLPATAHSSPSRKAFQPPHTNSPTSDSHTQPHGSGSVGFPWSSPPFISRPSGLKSSHTLKTSCDFSPTRLDPSSYASDPSSPTKESRLSWWKLSQTPIEPVGKGDKSGTLASWFQGESRPISLGVLPSPTKEDVDSPNKMSASPVDRPVGQTSSKPLLPSRFSFFTSKSSIQKAPSPPPDIHDEFLDLDIGKSLFPAGPADPFSPAAFKNLVQNAEGLLARLQAAYRERVISLHEMTVEKETQSEELEGAETRAKHLKIQLDNMAAKLAKQDELMMDMVDSLAREKQLRREEEDARKRSVMLVKASGPHAFNHQDRGILDADEYPRKRGSTLVSDSGFDSEEESYVDSVYSKPQGANSRNASVSSFSSPNSPDVYIHTDMVAKPPAARFPARNGPHALSAFQTATRTGSVASRHDDSAQTLVEKPPPTCTNCHGARSSQAWSLVHNLREENRHLEARVVQIESALDGCLDVVTQLGG